MPNKICKRCGGQYIGTAHSWYCEKCKDEVLDEQRKKDLERIKGRKIKNTCVICGKEFFSYINKDTCCHACDIKLKSIRKQGHIIEDNDKKKIVEKNCKAWHLISPDGVHYRFENLNQWASEHCELFGFEKSKINVDRIVSGISHARIGKKVSTYKDWKALDVPEQYGPKEIISLYKNGYSINRIHEITGKSDSKIRKLLFTEGLWSDELSDKISELKRQGKTTDEISELLNITKKQINERTPYIIYNYN